MLQRTFTVWMLCLWAGTFMMAQNTRTYDGSQNNLSNPNLGAANTQLLRYSTNGYHDGIAEPGGTDRPNPRQLSNMLFGQERIIQDPLNMSDLTWVFGQFMDHDLTFVLDDLTEPFMIRVPTGDVHFDPFGEGRAVVPMFRSAYDYTTGTEAGNPRQHINSITSWIDGSNVYGSSVERARWLRSNVDGKLKTSAGDLLPFNTVTGEFNDPIDPEAPHMDNANPTINKLFVAGDARANEQPLLLSVHTLFVREHNRLCDEIAEAHPSWNDEQIFQHARRIVIGIIQCITYEEWLPAMGVHLPEYTGYDPSVDPTIMNVFSAAAFRLGHTLVNPQIIRLTNEGDTLTQGSVGLRDAFFNPLIVVTGGGIDPYFKGMATQTQQNLDCKVIDDLRNFLFGAPGAGGLDLAAININRGRERGLADYNTIRSDFGLPAATQFRDITIDPETIAGMASAYGSVDQIDPWVGMLAEDHMENALFGPTIMTIMMQQFTVLRDGDRFYFEVDPGLSLEEVQDIRQTKMVDVIRRNTDIDIMQENVFYAMPHEDIPAFEGELPDNNLSMVVYPNPIGPEFSVGIFAGSAGNAQLQISDMLGRLIYETPVDLLQGENFIQMQQPNGMARGIYHISVIKENKVGSYRISVEN
ncbi:MAG: peroxidase family protein [Bacteroidota bacterium]